MRRSRSTFLRGIALGAALMAILSVTIYAAPHIARSVHLSHLLSAAFRATVVNWQPRVNSARSSTTVAVPGPLPLIWHKTLYSAVLDASRRHKVQVTGVVVDNSSTKVDYAPVPGAKDYRVVDLDNPGVTKYAGLLQSAPVNEIEWNTLGDGKPHHLVVQALDQLGPVPLGNLYDGNNQPTMPPMAGMAGMLGSDAGKTGDGLVSINGQGPSSNTPHVIAQSQPFVVRANPALRPIPSRPDATQTFFDTFDSAQSDPIAPTGTVDRVGGSKQYTLGAGTTHPWTIQYQGTDTDHSQPFVMDNHFMDVFFDGSTTAPKHVAHGIMDLSPDPTADLSGGKVLHATMEVDAHESGRRWIDFNLAPANDPLTNFYTENAPINKSDRAFFVGIVPGQIGADLFAGPSGATDGHPTDVTLMGTPGSQHPLTYGPRTPRGNGRGLDDRSRFDLFVSTTHFAVFEDGTLVGQSDIPGGLGFDQAKVYFSHYVYHTANDHGDLLTYSPYETYWINNFPWSDERHWDNMGFEVLPPQAAPTGHWASLASLVALPAASAPVFDPTAAAPTIVAPSATGTPPGLPGTINATATSTSSVMAGATAVPSPTTTATTPPATSSSTATATTSPGLPSTTSTTPTTSTVTGLPSGHYTIETRIIDAQGNVKLVTTAPLVIP